MPNAWHLAELNVARSLEPLDAPLLADFMAMLGPINALAETSPGFVWRLETDVGNALDVRLLDDARLVVNFSIWTSIEALTAFVSGPGHADVMRRRRKWFEVLADPALVLWWIPEGTIPTIAEAAARLEDLRREGPSPRAFTLSKRFPPP